MSGFEVLGAVCCVFQTISFAHEALNACRNFYEGRPVSLDSLLKHSKEVEAASTSIHEYLTAIQSPANPLDGEKVVKVLERTQSAAKQLRSEIEYVTKKRQAGKVAGSLITYGRQLWKKGKIDSLNIALQECHQSLQILLAGRSIKQIDAIELQQSSKFEILSDEMKQIVREISKNKNEMTLTVKGFYEAQTKDLRQLSIQLEETHLKTMILTREEGELTRNRTTKEAAQTRDHVSHEMLLQLEQNTRDQFLESLKFPEMNMRRNQISDPDDAVFEDAFRGVVNNRANYAQDETTKELTKFYQWLSSGDRQFWISGLPGSGKSTLMKFLQSQGATKTALQRWAPGGVVILSYYFWKPGEPMQKTSFGALCSVLYQTLEIRKDVIEILLAENPSYLRKRTYHDWTWKEVRDAVISIFNHPSGGSYCLFIDGLDEAEETIDGPDFLEISQALIQIPRLKLCLSSRPEPKFKYCLSELPKLHLHRLTCRSMTKFIHQKLNSQMEKAGWSPKQQDELRKLLIDKAEGVFLWLCLVVHSIVEGIRKRDSWSDTIARTQVLPQKLDALYQNMWERLGDDDFDNFRRTLAQWINTYVLLSPTASASQRSVMLLSFACAGKEEWETPLLMGDVIQATQRFKRVSELCKRGFDIAEMRCLGFFQLVEHGSKSLEPLATKKDRQKFLDVDTHVDQAILTSISFIHRSVYEFFTQSPTGIEILQHDSSTASDRHVNIALAYAQMLVYYAITEPCSRHELGARAFPLSNSKLGECAYHVSCTGFSRSWNVRALLNKISFISRDLGATSYLYLEILSEIFCLARLTQDVKLAVQALRFSSLYIHNREILKHVTFIKSLIGDDRTNVEEKHIIQPYSFIELQIPLSFSRSLFACFVEPLLVIIFDSSLKNEEENQVLKFRVQMLNLLLQRMPQLDSQCCFVIEDLDHQNDAWKLTKFPQFENGREEIILECNMAWACHLALEALLSVGKVPHHIIREAQARLDSLIELLGVRPSADVPMMIRLDRDFGGQFFVTVVPAEQSLRISNLIEARCRGAHPTRFASSLTKEVDHPSNFIRGQSERLEELGAIVDLQKSGDQPIRDREAIRLMNCYFGGVPLEDLDYYQPAKVDFSLEKYLFLSLYERKMCWLGKSER